MNTNSLETYAINKNKIKINFVNSSIELTILTPEIIRVFQNRGTGEQLPDLLRETAAAYCEDKPRETQQQELCAVPGRDGGGE